MSGSFWKVSIEWLSCFGLRRHLSIRNVTQRSRRIRCLGRCDARRVIGLTGKTDRVATTSEAKGMTSPAVTPTSPEPTRGGSQRPTRWRWRRLPKYDVDEPLATSRMRRDWSMIRQWPFTTWPHPVYLRLSNFWTEGNCYVIQERGRRQRE